MQRSDDQLSQTAYFEMLAAYEKGKQLKQTAKEKLQKEETNFAAGMMYEITKDVIKDYEEKLIYHSQDAIAGATDEVLSKREPQLSVPAYLDAITFHKEANENLTKMKSGYLECEAEYEAYVQKHGENPAMRKETDEIKALYKDKENKTMKNEVKACAEQLIYNSQDAIRKLYGAKSAMFTGNSSREHSKSDDHSQNLMFDMDDVMEPKSQLRR